MEVSGRDVGGRDGSDADKEDVGGRIFGIAAASDRRFSFNASVYTQEELEGKRHNFELAESGNTILCLDYALNGLGSNSCGPAVMEKYRFDEERFCFEFQLAPFIS